MARRYPLPRKLALALRAGLDLATARIALATIKPQHVVERNRAIGERVARAGAHRSVPDPAAACEEAAFFITRMAARIPWRSDCLVQALAGQHWLAREGIASEIVIGTAKSEDGSLAAHAWLRQQERIVLGGDISIYETLLDPATIVPRQP